MSHLTDQAIIDSIYRAQKWITTGQYDAAKQQLHALLNESVYPKNDYTDVIYADLGYIAYYQQDYVHSAACFSRSHQINPAYEKAILGWAGTLCEMQQAAKALQLLQTLPVDTQKKGPVVSRMVNCAICSGDLATAYHLLEGFESGFLENSDESQKTDAILYRKAQTKYLFYACEWEKLLGILMRNHTLLESQNNFYYYLSHVFFLGFQWQEAWLYYTRNLLRRMRRETPLCIQEGAVQSVTINTAWYAGQGIGDQVFFLNQVLKPDATADLKQTWPQRIYVDERLLPIARRSWSHTGAHFLPHSLCKEPVWLVEQVAAQQLTGFDRVQANGSVRACSVFTQEYIAQYTRNFPGRLRIGISWKSGNVHNGFLRSVPLALLSPLFARIHEGGGQCIAVQAGMSTDDITLLENEYGVYVDPSVCPHSQLDRWLAQLASLDLLISVDNSALHLTGGMGKRVWCLVSQPADFRWLENMEFYRWYPEVRGFRQPQAFAWKEPVRAICQEWIQRDWGKSRTNSLVQEPLIYEGG